MKSFGILAIMAIAIVGVLEAEIIEELLHRARIAQKENDIATAIDLYREAIRLEPNHPQALFYLGEALTQTGQIAEGLRLMEQAVGIEPGYEWHLQIAELAEKNECIPIAISHYQSSLKFFREIPIYQKLVELFTKMGNLEQANYYRSQRVAVEMASIRLLPLRQELSVNSQSRRELKEFLLAMLDKDLPEQKARAVELSLVAFGLLSKDVDLRKLLPSILAEEVAGFYDPETKKLFLIKEDKKISTWERLLGGDQNEVQERMIMAHEITHALQDQHFDLMALEKKTKENDDRSLAMESLVEGDATLSMFDYQIQPARLLPRNTFALRMTFSLQNMLMNFATGEGIKSAPLIIRESLFFPYTEGFFFCLALRNNSIYDEINGAFTHLPASTEHILHPEKYFSRDLPSDFALGDLSSLLGESWKQVNNNVMGEFTCIQLFQEYKLSDSKKIAAGWGGDRYSILQNSQGEVAIIWLTVWDTPEDAREFFQGYQQILKHKYPKAKLSHESNKTYGTQEKCGICLSIDKKQVQVLENIPVIKIEEIYKAIVAISPETTKN